MRHRVAGRKLGRKTAHRRALRRNMAASLFMHGQITTTIPKAKMVQPFVEKMITAAKKGDLASRRHVIAELRDRVIVRDDEDEDVKRNKYGEVAGGPKLVKKLFEEIAPQYSDRPGGYTRIIRLSAHRLGDGADLCVLQLVSDEDTGPQVAGQSSRRREKANRRMEFAAKLRSGGKADKAPDEEEAVATETAETDAEVATEDAVTEEAAVESEEAASETPENDEASDDAAEEDEKKDIE